jgi:uncharacterized membrane protein
MEVASTGNAAGVRRAWILPGAILLGAFLLRCVGLGSQSIWVDEAYSYSYARPDSPLTAAHLLENLHGPLHALVLHVWMKLFGTSEAALRFPSVLASVGSLAAFWCLARRRWGQAAAAIGLLLMALGPFHIWYAQETRNYAFLILFAILTESAFDRVLCDGPSGARLARYGLALLGGLLSNLSMALLLPVQAVRLALFARRPRTGEDGAARHPAPARLGGSVLLVWALVAVCFSPWVVAFYERQVQPSHLLTTEAAPTEEKMRQGTTDSPLGIPFTIYSFATGYSFGPSRRELWQEGPQPAVTRYLGLIALAAIAFGTLWVRGMLRTWRADRREAWALLVGQLLPILIVYAISLRNVKAINPRYAAVAYPAFIATLALGALAGPRAERTARPSRRHEIGRIALALVLAISLASIVRGLTMPTYWKEATRPAAAWLRQNLEPGDAFVSMGIDDPLRDFYMRPELRGQAPVPWTNLGRIVAWRGRFAKRYAAEVLPAWRPGTRLFVFITREWATDADGALEADLRQRARLIEERRWTGVRVLVLERKTPEEEQMTRPDVVAPLALEVGR